MVSESWFRKLWRTPKEDINNKESGDSSGACVLGVLSFEVASLMSKVLHLCLSLSDQHIIRLRDDITNSAGIRKLVSSQPHAILPLVCAELIDNMSHVARAVARLSTNCNDTSLKNFHHFFSHLIKTGLDPNGWAFSWKNMERKTNKMGRFISLNANLYQEIQVLTDLQLTLKRIKSNNNDTAYDSGGLTCPEFEKKVAWKHQQVKNLKDISLWNKTYDYALLLLARSLFTIFIRITHVFPIHQDPSSFSTLIHHSPNDISIHASGPLANSVTKSGPMLMTTKTGNRSVNFYSGPLRMQKPKSSPFSGTSKTIQRLWQRRDNPSVVQGKKNVHNPNPNRLTTVRFSSPLLSSSSTHIHSGIQGRSNTDELAFSDVCFANLSIFSPKQSLLNAPADTLGGAALALHYANVIIVIEKLVASPHLIGHDARDDLYNMLPARVRAALRERLKPYAKNLTSSLYDTVLAGEWTDAMAGILEWLAPLAHNMIKWQSERSFEQQNFVSKTNVFLVQTLYFANQEKTEATITELLVGLNYIWRFGRELNAKALLECPSSKIFDQYLDLEG